MRVIITKNYEELSKRAAVLINAQLMWKPDSVLGLATGSTPVGLYEELVKNYQDKYIDFSDVTTFNLDEYIGLDENNQQSYISFMQENLFDHVNIAKENIHIPNGMTNDLDRECKAYEEAISAAGGIDLQILGIGHNGHIGFNEPNSKFEAGTHVVTLDQETIEANKRFFDSIDDVPKEAISMGIKTIMKSEKIILMASGAGKAETIKKLLSDDISPNHPASVLHLHENVVVILDQEAAALL